MIRNCIIVAQRKNWVSEPTHPPVEKILFFTLWYHVFNIPFEFLSRKKKINMVITVALCDQKHLSFLESISLLLFSIIYPLDTQISWVWTNSNMLLWIYSFCSRVNVDFHWYYFIWFMSLSLFPSASLSGCRCLNWGKAHVFWSLKRVPEKIPGLASMGKVRYPV